MRSAGQRGERQPTQLTYNEALQPTAPAGRRLSLGVVRRLVCVSARLQSRLEANGQSLGSGPFFLLDNKLALAPPVGFLPFRQQPIAVSSESVIFSLGALACAVRWPARRASTDTVHVQRSAAADRPCGAPAELKRWACNQVGKTYGT